MRLPITLSARARAVAVLSVPAEYRLLDEAVNEWRGGVKMKTSMGVSSSIVQFLLCVTRHPLETAGSAMQPNMWLGKMPAVLQ